MMPAFSSPAPTRIFGDFVGKVLSNGRLFLYEQCSLHITEKMPSSVYDNSRPRIPLAFSYSSGVRLCCRTNSGVIAGSFIGMFGSKFGIQHLENQRATIWRFRGRETSKSAETE